MNTMAARPTTIELPIMTMIEMQHQQLGKLKGYELILNAKGRATIGKLEGAGKPPYRVVIAGTESKTVAARP